jgi:hypothetical protein
LVIVSEEINELLKDAVHRELRVICQLQERGTERFAEEWKSVLPDGRCSLALPESLGDIRAKITGHQILRTQFDEFTPTPPLLSTGALGKLRARTDYFRRKSSKL